MSSDDRRPVVAAIAVAVREGRFLLVRRAHPPDLGLWGFPGGKVEWGETVVAAAIRELAEETGIVAQPDRILTVLDEIRDPATGSDGRAVPDHHYVLIAVTCRPEPGEAVAASDAAEAAWFTPAEIAALGPRASRKVAWVARQAAAG